jgi:pyridoxal phosphate enzyme (YggS family)
MGYSDVQHKIANLANQTGRDPNSIRLIAVSKTHPADAVRSIYQMGQRDFGENYVSELLTKAESLKDLSDLKWVFIGQLQTNKIQKLVTVASEIQTIAAEKHARYIERYVSEAGKESYPVWIHANAGDEEQKFGVSLEEGLSIAQFIMNSCPHLELQGLMAIPPASYNDESYGDKIPDLYQKLIATARAIGKGRLSLGMSNDLRIAIAAGSDCIRIGTAIFGKR